MQRGVPHAEKCKQMVIEHMRREKMRFRGAARLYAAAENVKKENKKGRTNMNATSAYAQIKANVGADGKLPYSFSLAEAHAPNQIDFIPGAMDGIGMFHAGPDDAGEAVNRIVRLLGKYFKTGKERYIADVEAVLNHNRTISVIDPVLQKLHDEKGIDPNKVANLSLHLVKTSGHIELIKIGIGLLGLLDLGNAPEATEVLTTLALYEDFTLYAVVAASNWPNGNGVIFQIAKCVVGWGKIHAVERLKPETEEIREWILRSGCVNSVMDAYLGLVCATKGDLISALRQETIDPEMFDSIAVIVDALVDEGPVSGISEYEHAQEALMRYLGHTRQHMTGAAQLWRILNLQDWAEEAEVAYKDAVLAGCHEIINRAEWQETIMATVERHDDAVDFFCACNAAFRLNIDISAELFEIVKAEPLPYCAYMPRLMKNPDMAASLISLCESVLPLDEMAEGMGDYFFADKLHQEYECLDFVLPALAAYPRQGEKLIKTGLNSRVVRCRNMACRALSGWVSALEKPVSEISPALYSELARIYKIEVDAQTKRTMKNLLDGGDKDA